MPHKAIKDMLVALSVCAVSALVFQTHMVASVRDANEPLSPIEDHYLLHDECLSQLNKQIRSELYASMAYLNMAAYFGRPSVAKNGYAKFFRAQSKEEYDHALKFIDYINSRNGSVERIAIEESPKAAWISPVDALRDAIRLENDVYSSLQYMHQIAEQKCQDSHLTDYLEGEFFTEQVSSIEELQNMLAKIDVASASPVIIHITDEKLAKRDDL